MSSAQVIVVRPTADATLQEAFPDNNFGDGTTFTAGDRRRGGRTRALLLFNIATNVPAGATVTSATLTVKVTSTPSGGVNSIFDINRVTASWGEGNGSDRGGSPGAANQVTWRNRLGTGTPWTTQGGDFAAVASSSQSIAGSGSYTFSSTAAMVSDVQSWLNNPSGNFGWTLRSESEGTATTIRRFGSREDPANAPTLTIQFTPAASPDTNPPTISCPTNTTRANDPGQCSALVTYTATATDDRPGVTFTCNPPSGSVFPKGTTTVTCTAIDAAGNRSTCSFTVTVTDTERPTIVCPTNITLVAATGQCGAVVNYATPTATDNCPGVTVTCSPPSGSFFPVGTTTVTCTASDASGNSATCSFTVTVTDTEKPTIACPVDVVTNTAPGQCSRIVNYPVPIVTDNCPGVTLTCNPPSGSAFPTGTNLVNCTATDASGNKATCTFTVTVNDTEPPSIIACTTNIFTTVAAGQASAIVNYSPPAASDNCDPKPTITCNPPSGSNFPVGATTVTCTATDASGNATMCLFTVTVTKADADLALTKTSDLSQINLGSNLTYTITLTNRGPASATAVIVRDTLPVGMTFVSATLDQGNCTQAPANERFLNQAHLDLLNRPIDPNARAFFLNAMSQGTTRGQVAQTILSSPEYRQIFVESLYPRFLRRAADAAGVNAFINQWAAGATVEQIIATLLGSQEYFVNRGGGTNDGFLDALYDDLLHRPVDSAGRNAFLQALAAGSTRSQVATDILRSPEYLRLLVQGFYQQFLRRAADNSGLNAIVNLLQQDGRDEQGVAILVGSDEYLALAGAMLTCDLGTLGNGETAVVKVAVTPTRAGAFTNSASVTGNETDPNPADNAGTASTLVIAPPPSAPAISTQPQGQAVALGNAVSLSVVAVGTAPLAYQWRLNGANIAGATGATLTINSFQLANAGSYRVTVANALGAVDSDAVLLVPANVTSLPLTNNFNDRVVLSDLTRAGTGSNVGANKENNEPNHAGKPGGKSVWITWQAPTNGVVTFSTAGSAFDTLLAVYTGDTLNSLVEVASDEDHGGFLTSQLSFNAVAGTRYQVAIDGFWAAQGDLVLNWTLEPTVETVPAITTQPQSQTVGVGNTATFSVTAAGTGLSYQWVFNGSALPGANGSSFTVTNVQPANVGNYFVRVSRGTRFVDSQAASLEINGSAAGTLVEQVATTDKFADLIRGLFTPPSGALQSANWNSRSRGKASLARGYSGTQIFNTFAASKEAGEPNHCGVIGGASQWFVYQAVSHGQLTITTDGSDFDSVLAVYTGTGVDFASLVSVACDNDSGLDGKDSRVSFAATAGTVYFIAVDGVGAATGNVRLNYDLSAPPHLELLGRSGSGFPGLKLTGLPGRTYAIEGSTNLINWTGLLTTNVTAGIFNFQDSAAGSLDRRFYRAVMQP
jgi:uncharacterized repeat protein (TIGR01451 family)